MSLRKMLRLLSAVAWNVRVKSARQALVVDNTRSASYMRTLAGW